MGMDVSGFELDFEQIGIWPTSIKITVVVLTFLLILGVGYWFDIRIQIKNLKLEQSKQISLEKQINEEQKKVWPILVLEQQIKTIKTYLEKTLAQLPSSDEIPKVIEDISTEGIKAGLEFKSIRPLNEIKHSFYAEMPISISVVGNYHQLGHFLSNLSALPRYITIEDFSIKFFVTDEKYNKKQMDNDPILIMTLQADIYRNNIPPKGEK